MTRASSSGRTRTDENFETAGVDMAEIQFGTGGSGLRGWPAVARWVPALEARQCFGAIGVDARSGPPSPVASDMFKYFGGVRNPETAFAAGADGRRVACAIGSVFGGDEDADVCDGKAMAGTIVDGFAAYTIAPEYEFHTVPQARCQEIKERAAIAKALLGMTASDAAASALAKRNPHVIKLATDLDALKTLVGGEVSHTAINRALHAAAASVGLVDCKLLDGVALRRINKAMSAHAHAAAADGGGSIDGRVQSLADLANSHAAGAFSGSEGAGGGSGRGETHLRAHAQALLAKMNSETALLQLRRFNFCGQRCDEITCFETMVSGEAPPELVKAIEAEIEAIPPGKNDARVLELRKYLEAYEPLAPVHQLTYGGVKSIVGHPELTMLREVATHRLPEVLGRVVARCFSPDGKVVQPHMAFLKLDELAAAVAGSAADIAAIDFVNMADAPALARFTTGLDSHFVRVLDTVVYRCPFQMARLGDIAPAVLALMGVKRSPEHGWQRITVGVQYLSQTTGFAQASRFDRLTTAIHAIVTGSLKEVSLRIHQMRTSARPDISMDIRLVPAGSHPINRWNEMIVALAVSMGRERTDAEGGTGERGPLLQLPSIHGAAAPPAKRQATVAAVSFAGVDAASVEKMSGKGGQGEHYLYPKVRVKEGGTFKLSAPIKMDAGAAEKAMQAAKPNAKGYCLFGILGGDDGCAKGSKCPRSHKGVSISLKQFVCPPSTWPANAAI